MKGKKRAFVNMILLPAALLLISWGYMGHQNISLSISKSFTEEMAQFIDWVGYLHDHASDADQRKYSDPSEGPKHYLDIDNYPEFDSTGRIPQTLDSCIAIYGRDFVDDNGYLPWATMDSYDTLVKCFERADWDKAKQTAADLGHYVADGHMPLHITRNYNGQYSGNYDIHGRYESDMVNEYINEFIYEGTPVEDIDSIRNYIFAYVYNSYQYVDSVLIGDDYASEMSDGVYNTTYYKALWERTSGFTISLFEDASHAFANLFYNAWREAGKPLINPPSQVIDRSQFGIELMNYPNPFSESTNVSFTLLSPLNVTVWVTDATGRTVALLKDGPAEAGHTKLCWKAEGESSGIYFLVLDFSTHREVRTMIKK